MGAYSGYIYLFYLYIGFPKVMNFAQVVSAPKDLALPTVLHSFSKKGVIFLPMFPKFEFSNICLPTTVRKTLYATMLIFKATHV